MHPSWLDEQELDASARKRGRQEWVPSLIAYWEKASYSCPLSIHAVWPLPELGRPSHIVLNHTCMPVDCQLSGFRRSPQDLVLHSWITDLALGGPTPCCGGASSSSAESPQG